MKLEAGKTLIGKTNAKDKESQLIYEFEVYYGNILYPPRNNKVGHLPKDEYEKVLNDFLNTDEGLKYDLPTDVEVEQANIEMLNKEMELLASMKKSVAKNPPSPIKNEEQNANDNSDVSYNEEPVSSPQVTSSQDVQEDTFSTSNKQTNSTKSTYQETQKDEEVDDEEYDDDEEYVSPEIKAYRKKILGLIVVIALQFIAIVILAITKVM